MRGGTIEQPSDSDHSGSIAIHAPYGEDGRLVETTLRAARIPCVRCRSPEELERMLRGGAGVLVLSQEALSEQAIAVVGATVATEPVWSELPILLLVDARFDWEVPWSNTTLLRRPIGAEELVSVVRLARASRGRQITIGDLLGQLAEANARLEERVAERTRELQRYSERLEREVAERKAVQQALRRARMRLASRQEEDRRRLGRDLHDDVVQRLLALSMDLARGPGSGDPGAGGARRDGYRREVLEIVDDVRGLIRQLHPIGLDLGIAEALEEFVRSTRERTGGSPRIELSAAYDHGLPREVALCLYRSTQELVRNSLRHADAERIDIRLEVDADAVRLTVADDGVGFEPPANLNLLGMDEHFGLIGVAEHVGALSGELAIESALGRGTEARLRLPRDPAPVAPPGRPNG